MREHARREFLTAAAGAIAAGLAGCGDGEEPEPGLHAVFVIVLSRAGHPEYDAATDRMVRVTVENTDIERHRGTLSASLRPADGEAVDIPPKTADVNLPGGTTRSYEFIFRDVAGGPEDAFEASASIRPA